MGVGSLRNPQKTPRLMLVKSYAAAVKGIDAIIVTVETVVDRGMQYCIVGLPDAAVKESQERVR